MRNKLTENSWNLSTSFGLGISLSKYFIEDIENLHLRFTELFYQPWCLKSPTGFLSRLDLLKKKKTKTKPLAVYRKTITKDNTAFPICFFLVLCWVLVLPMLWPNKCCQRSKKSILCRIACTHAQKVKTKMCQKN